jgi:Spy/CpxP family protein refolding chaperone
MRLSPIAGSLAAVLALALPAAAGPATTPPATQDELGRVFDELAGQLQNLGERLIGQIFPGDPAERPLVTIMLEHRSELGLTASQVQELERVRADFQREAIRLDADQRIAQMDLSALLRSDQVDMAKVESKIRELERLRADMRIGRIRAIERGKAQLTPEQRSRLQALLGETTRPRADAPGGSGQRL